MPVYLVHMLSVFDLSDIDAEYLTYLFADLLVVKVAICVNRKKLNMLT